MWMWYFGPFGGPVKRTAVNNERLADSSVLHWLFNKQRVQAVVAWQFVPGGASLDAVNCHVNTARWFCQSRLLLSSPKHWQRAGRKFVI
jgi:hypothetical protein